jgi:cytochrome c-type biogenesis protein CcmH
MKRIVVLMAALLTSLSLHANDAAPLADDPVVEQRLITISEELRCLVCQNESLAGSRAELANDLRREVRMLIKSGKTDAEIRDFLVSRYGDFVLYRPPVKPTTWLLWLGPFVLLLGGLAVLIFFLRQQRNRASTQLSADEQRQAKALIAAVAAKQESTS